MRSFSCQGLSLSIVVNGIGGTLPEAIAINAGGRRNQPVMHKNKVSAIVILPKLLCHLNKCFSSEVGFFFRIKGTNQNKMPVKVKIMKTIAMRSTMSFPIVPKSSPLCRSHIVRKRLTFPSSLSAGRKVIC